MSWASPFDAHISVTGNTGPGSFPYGKRTPQNTQPGKTFYETPVPRLPFAGPNPLKPGVWIKRRFIPPLALFNDASQWVNDLYLPRPTTVMQAPDGLPLPPTQYSIGPRPINTNKLAAGQINLQQQLGSVRIQAAKFTQQANDYFGG